MTTWGAGCSRRLDALVANNAIVVHGTDNGVETGTWPDGGTMPFHGEKGTTWEGGFRVPMLVRWPGCDQAGHDRQRNFSQEDLLPDYNSIQAMQAMKRLQHLETLSPPRN